MKTLKYNIEFHTYWHCGSGLAAGADVDALVIKDKNNMPYIPGKTIKGLIREAVDEIIGVRPNCFNEDDYLKVFGYLDDGGSEKKDEEMKKSDSFFTNANLVEYKEIVKDKLQRFLFTSISNTAIDPEGVAKEHSLRKIEVVVPCKLSGEIINVPDSMVKILSDAAKFIKNLGANRNRGLGRCTIIVKEAIA